MKKRRPKKFYRFLLFKRGFIVFLLLLQVAFIIALTIIGDWYFVYLGYFLNFLSIIIVLHIAGKKQKAAYKLIWAVQILIFPLLGGLSYLLFNIQSSTRKFNKEMRQIEKISKPLYFLPGDILPQAKEMTKRYTPQMRYLQNKVGYPVYINTLTKYLSPGEEKFRYMLTELKKAKRYIFLEYFIIKDGIMWDSVLKILCEKAAKGVDVRLIYDDIGCFLNLPDNYKDELKQYGIKSTVFNPFKPLLSAMHNNRDHRKILVIDGKTAFTGGANIADEYINAHERFGHWKDAAIMINGDAAWSLTLIFLEMWAMCTKEPVDFVSFYPYRQDNKDKPQMYVDGLVIPYADSPMDAEHVSEHVYMQIINTAHEYLYINSPYLIVDDSMISALTLAAKSGVDVRIVTPYRGDKWYVQMTTRSYYRELISAGVKVYEYSKGFIHSKTFVSDDSVATIGTVNLDYRSLYLHFECGVWMYKSRAVTETRDDFLKTLENCRRVKTGDFKTTLFSRLLQDTLRLFAPLL